MRKPLRTLRLVWAGRALLTALLAALQATASHGQQPARTSITDTVYRADGSAASGTVLISWPEFTTADGKPVAAGTLNMQLGTGGAFSVALAPNAGANPDGTFYKIVLKLDDGTTESEAWVVPSSATPVTIAAVRATVVPSSVALQVASRQYVDDAIATRATNVGVVHLAGSETITGTKQFSSAPAVPTPVLSTDAVNKAYVDQSVATVGAGSFVAKAGDAMTGPLNLSGENGARICFFYPRLAPLKKVNAGSAAQSESAHGVAGTASTLASAGLHAAFLAFPVTDVNDGEQILCYRSLFPAASAALY